MNDDNNTNQSPPKSKLCGFGYADYIFLASTIAISLAEDFNADDLSILSSFFAVLSDELALIASVEVCPNNNDNSTNISGCNSYLKKKRTIRKKVKRKK